MANLDETPEVMAGEIKEVDFSSWTTKELVFLRDSLAKLITYGEKLLKARELWELAMHNLHDKNAFHAANKLYAEIQTLVKGRCDPKGMPITMEKEGPLAMAYLVACFTLIKPRIDLLCQLRKERLSAIPPMKINFRLTRIAMKPSVEWFIQELRKKFQNRKG